MAVPNANQCAPAFSPSGWVLWWAQMCDGSLAVNFKGGVTCWYFSAPPAYWEMALAWHDAGEFVRTFLWKKLPYRVIPFPCPPAGCGGIPAPCCPGALLPATVHVTFGNCTGAMAPLSGLSVPLTNSGAGWQNASFTAGGTTYNIFFNCGSPNIVLGVQILSGPQSGCSNSNIVTTLNCTPLLVSFPASSWSYGCNGYTIGQATVTR